MNGLQRVKISNILKRQFFRSVGVVACADETTMPGIRPRQVQSQFFWEKIMAKKAKRRGRPPGSKNKGTVAKVGKLANSVSKMDVRQLRDYISTLETSLAAKVQQQREYLEGQLDGLRIYADNKAGAAVRAMMRVTKTRTRAKAKPKYQSKKHKRLKWSGRGMLPVWMREEMKGTKLTKENFLIR
jgi:DNA-binding protein H-NS